MNIYSQKRLWKIALFLGAFFIVAISIWYSNTLVSKMAKDERVNVKLWAQAIRNKAALVKYTNGLFTKLRTEERKKVELWANGTKQLANPELNMEDLSFIFEVVQNNETVPVILTDKNGVIISFRNLDSTRINDKAYLMQELEEMRIQHDPIVIYIGRGQKNYLYYKDSKLFSELKNVFDGLINSFISEIVINSASIPVILTDSSGTQVIASGNIDSLKIKSPELLASTLASMSAEHAPLEIDLGKGERNLIFYENSFLLTQLKYYPFAQFAIIGLFLLIAYFLFSTARRAEQNQVWVGMSKETAHQLGTPLSSLMAWLEILKSKAVDPAILAELAKDVKRLETITDRFSKIGSTPKLEKENVFSVLENSVNYMKSRTSHNIQFKLNQLSGKDIFAFINVPLFEWVVENLVRNSADAMDGKGIITIDILDQTQFVYIDVADTGKGIPKSHYKTIFQPGYTTRQRGWGLGLSLSKRIIENYHSGKIFVKSSEINKGTTIRIVLNK